MIKNYLHYRKTLFFFYLIVIIFFPLIHWLYKLPMQSVGYSILILTFILTLWLLIDGFRFRSRVNSLEDIRDHLTTYHHQLPAQKDKLESEYQQMIESLYDIIRSHEESIEKVHLEQVEYYTLWVHQIKTPISAMRLALQSKEAMNQDLLLDQELFKIEQYVELALHYTKMKDISTDMVIRECLLEEIVHQSVKKYASLFIYKKLTIKIQEFHCEITTDSKWLAFIMEQLLSNAIKYTHHGGLEITYENQTLQIKDTGMGIRSEDIERIFEKGYTGYNGRIDKKASGIGLYLVKKVADSLAIKVDINSILGVGTTANITFPLQNSFLFTEANVTKM